MKRVAIALIVLSAACGNPSPPTGQQENNNNGMNNGNNNNNGMNNNNGNNNNNGMNNQPSCDGAWSLGSTFYKGSDIGGACSPANAPQNCLTGMYVLFNDGRCYCTADCGTAHLNAGDACTQDGSVTCKQVVNKTGESGGLICVAAAWNLCAGQVMHKCTADGDSCSSNSDCCSGTCGSDGNCAAQQ